MTETGSEAWGSRLLPHHVDVLAERGVSAEVARERKYVSATDKAQLKRLGFGPSQQIPTALVIPSHPPSGNGPATWILRPDAPRINQRGKLLKYEWMAGRPLRLDVPVRCQPAVTDPTVTLWITEGPIKADALASAGAGCVIAIAGVWAWKSDNPLPDWDDVALKHRRVLLCFDSDVMAKKEVHQALTRLWAFLERRNARPEAVYLPNDDTKVDIDGQ